MSGETEVRQGARAPTRDDVVMLVDFSIRRALAFGGLAIATTMTALCFDPVLSFRVGAVMAAAILFGLLFKAFEATRCKIRRTEIWILLDSAGQRPAPGVYPLIAAVLRERYLWHADAIALGALGLWGMAGLFWLGQAV